MTAQAAAMEPHQVNLEQASRALIVCFAADIPVALWGGVGIGKSSVLRQMADQTGYRFYDCRLSDKEPGDFCIPYPHHESKRLETYVTSDLPFDTDEKAIIAFDEVDRAQMAVQNVALQLFLDRALGRHKLSPNARIVMAGNATTDIGTSVMSDAALGRMVHLYIDSTSDGAVKAWVKWATKNNVSPALVTFAQHRTEVWSNARDVKKVPDLARPNQRSFVNADRLYSTCKAMNFNTDDILPALMAGCVGMGAAVEFLAWWNISEKCPTIEEVIAHPDTAPVPDEVDILYAFGQVLAARAREGEQSDLEAVCQYAIRWPREQTAALFTQMSATLPQIAGVKEYKNWLRKQAA